MSDPFVRPVEPSPADAIAAIGDELDVFDDWMDRYQYIIELGRKLPQFPDAWRTMPIACRVAKVACGWKAR